MRDETVIDFRVSTSPPSGLPAIRFASLFDVDEQRAGNLACPSQLRLAQVIFQKMPQIEIQYSAQK